MLLALVALSRDDEAHSGQSAAARGVPDCSGALDVTRYLQCAEAACQATIREQLPARLRAGAVFGAAQRVDHADLRFVRLVGGLDTPGSPPTTLQRGYECELEGLTVAHARVIN